ncbi:MAG: hypothetical protein HOJ48_00800, partial [Desulfobacula sp.]|nr:hypothetical protein [Desulfobacula sp.]
FPSALEHFIRERKEFSNEYQIHVPKQGVGNRLRIKVEPSSVEVPSKDLQAAKQKLIDKVKLNMTVTPAVEIANIGELPRFEAKAKRLYRE